MPYIFVTVLCPFCSRSVKLQVAGAAGDSSV